MLPLQVISYFALFTATTLCAPGLQARDTSPQPLPDTICQTALKHSPCTSKTSAYSCFLAARTLCYDVASDGVKANAFILGPPYGNQRYSTNGTCTATMWLTDQRPTIKECTEIFQSINDKCVTPGENPDPRKNLGSMRGWVNIDHSKCLTPANKTISAYQLSSDSCAFDVGADACNQ